MKFVKITTNEMDRDLLQKDFESAEKFGRYAVGKAAVYCPKMLRQVYIPIEEIIWAYRRQEAVEGRLCCGKAQFSIHKVILVTKEKQRFELAGMGKEQAKGILAALEQKNAAIDIGYSKEKEANYFPEAVNLG